MVIYYFSMTMRGKYFLYYNILCIIVARRCHTEHVKILSHSSSLLYLFHSTLSPPLAVASCYTPLLVLLLVRLLVLLQCRKLPLFIKVHYTFFDKTSVHEIIPKFFFLFIDFLPYNFVKSQFSVLI